MKTAAEAEVTLPRKVCAPRPPKTACVLAAEGAAQPAALPGLQQDDDDEDGRDDDVDDDEKGVQRMAPWMIPVKSNALRLAPPTSAPSTSGCDRSSAALSGLTDPP